jgi:hypothetical protein
MTPFAASDPKSEIQFIGSGVSLVARVIWTSEHLQGGAVDRP